MALRRRLLSIEEDEEPMFKVKKSKLSRQMAATKAPADLASFKKVKGAEKLNESKDPRRSHRSSRPEAVESVGVSEAAEESVEGEVITEPCEGYDVEAEDHETSAVQAARLARAQRAAARDTGGIRAPPAQGVDSSARIKALAAAAQRELNENEEPEDAAEAWALRQLEVGLHRRRAGQAPPEELDLEQEIAQLDTPLRPRDGVQQVRQAAERVAKGHDGADRTAVRTAESVLWAPGEAMAKLWDTMKTLEGSAENREVKLEELKSQRDAAQDELREIERQDKQISRSLRCVRELEEIAWSLGGLLDEKSAKCKQAITMLSQIEADFVKRRSQRRMRDLNEEPRMDLCEPDESEQRARREQALLARRARRQERRKRQGSETRSQEGFEQTAKDRSSFCAAVHRQLLEDVSEDFASASAVLKALKTAKQKLQEEYRQAFVHLSLPDVFGFFVEHSTLWWDPFSLCANGAKWGPRKALTTTQLEAFDWFEDLAAFTEMMGDDDPDGELVPKIVQKCIFPEVARRLRQCWDVTCIEQSKRAAALLDECLLFEVGEDGAFNELLLAALERLRVCLRQFAPEVFVPAHLVSSWYASPVRKRLLWRCCKIAACAAHLEGRVADEQLAPLVLREIFALRMAPHLQGPRLHLEEMDLLERFIEALPERWLDPLPAALSPLRDCLGPRAPKNAELSAERAYRLLQKMK
ncbi:unnamed protein product [Durusdinium trenchii]|uniref:GCF C-terminal domain-containing protein n=1 Tax=Durusdinium trenchii TaxID=1381693 RepID=A0ABP0RC00_9DINO